MIAYFIGGPFDLTKRNMVEQKLPMWFCIAPKSLDINEFKNEQSVFGSVRKHRYELLPPHYPHVVDMAEQPRIYIYQGVEE